MKRTALLIILITILISFASADNQYMNKHFQVQGFCDSVVSVVVDPIAAQSEKYRIGMPFNIEDVQVQNDQLDGRQIAHWSLGGNTDFILQIEADYMRYVGDPVPVNPGDESGEVEYLVPKTLPYVLTFSYKLAGESEEDSFAIDLSDHSIEFESPNHPIGGTGYANGVYIIDILAGTSVGEILANSSGDLTVSYAGILNGNVYFKFPRTISRESLADDTDYPPGPYEAQVTVTIMPKGE